MMFGATFSLLELGLRFLVGVALGVAIGLLAGYLVAAVRRRIENPLVEITISLFTGYATYLPTENGSRTSPRTLKSTATTRTSRHARRPSNASGASFWRRSAKPYCA